MHQPNPRLAHCCVELLLILAAPSPNRGRVYTCWRPRTRCSADTNSIRSCLASPTQTSPWPSRAWIAFSRPKCT